MTRVESTMEVAAPLDRVAAFFVPQRMPYWYGAEMDAEFEVQGGEAGFCAGQKVRITGKILRKEIADQYLLGTPHKTDRNTSSAPREVILSSYLP